MSKKLIPIRKIMPESAHVFTEYMSFNPRSFHVLSAASWYAGTVPQSHQEV